MRVLSSPVPGTESANIPEGLIASREVQCTNQPCSTNHFKSEISLALPPPESNTLDNTLLSTISYRFHW